MNSLLFADNNATEMKLRIKRLFQSYKNTKILNIYQITIRILS